MDGRRSAFYCRTRQASACLKLILRFHRFRSDEVSTTRVSGWDQESHESQTPSNRLHTKAPNDAPDNNFAGYDFWLNKLIQLNGDFLQAEMVKAFLASSEYRSRFGP